MEIVTYNIQYGKGADGRIDLGRIARAVEGADVIGLNEVERFWPRSSAVDQPAELSALLPAYYWVYGPYFDIDASDRLNDGTIRNRRQQHGSMILSRSRIIASRLHLLPKLESVSHFNMQMGGLEAIIDRPEAVRVYAVHLSSLTSEERMLQVQALLDIHRRTGVEGGMWTGSPIAGAGIDLSCGKSAPPNPTEAIVMGDFNCESDALEYRMIVGARPGEKSAVRYRQNFVDSWTEVGNGTAGASHFAKPQRGVSDFEIYRISLTQRFVTLPFNRRVMNKNLLPLF